MDLYACKIVGWSLSSHMRTNLVCSALDMAITARQSSVSLVAYTDQGNQYASYDYLKLLAIHNITACMSGRGNCYDNAVMKRFFLNLKIERVWQKYYTNN